MTELLTWVFAALFVLVIIAWYLSYTAARFDRLHVRLGGTLAALDARLVRRAEAAVELAHSGLLDGATSLCSPRPRGSRSRPRPSTARRASRPRATSPRRSTSP